MADTTATILVQLMDEASKGFQKIQKAGEDMARELSGNLGGLKSTGEAIKSFTDPLVEGLGKSKKAAIGFESEMAEVAKVSGFSAKQIEEVGKITKGLSREIPMTTSGLNDIATAAGQSGIALKDTKGFITDVAKAATAFYGGSSAKELEKGAKDAALAFGKITNIFDIPINKVSTLAAAINVLGDSSIASERDIINAMTRTSALGKQAQLTAKEMAALNASMISLGMAPSVAATATNALLSRLTTAEIQSARFQKGLDMIGISAANMQQLVQSGGNNAIFALSDALDKLDPVKRAQAIGQMFGAEHSDNVGIFLDRIELYKQLLGSVSNDQQNLNRYNQVFEAQVNTTASQIQILNNAYQELAIEIGTALLPAIKAFVRFLTPIIQGISAFAKKHPNIVRIGAALVGVAAAAGSAMLAMAALGRTWEGIQAGIPILAKLSDRFLGVGNPVSKFLNKMAGANQRLQQTASLTDKIAAPDMQMGKIKDCLPICICPELCEEGMKKLKAVVAQIGCLPICICPEICDAASLKLAKPDVSPAGEMASQAHKAAPETPTPVAEVAKEIKQPVKEAEQTRRIGIPQIIALTVALLSATNAIKKLTDSNANLASKALSVVGAITAANTAREMLKPKEAAAEVAQQVPAVTPIETPAVVEAQKLGAIELQNQSAIAAAKQAQQALEIANAEKLSTIELQRQNQLAAAKSAQQTAEVAHQEKLNAVESARLNNQMQVRQQMQAQQLASATQLANLQTATADKIAQSQASVINRQVAAAATVAGIQNATNTDNAIKQQAAAIQVGNEQKQTAANVANIQKEAETEKTKIAQARQQLEAQAASEKLQVAEQTAVVEEKAAVSRQKKGGGLGIGGLLPVVAGGALLGGAGFLATKVFGGIGGAFNAAKSAVGAIGNVVQGAGKVAGAVGSGVNAASKTMGAINSVASGAGKVAGTGIAGAVKSYGAALEGARGAGSSIGQAIGSAIKGTQSLGQAAQSAGSGIAGAIGKTGSTIVSVGSKIGEVAGGAASNIKSATGALGGVAAPASKGTMGLIEGIVKGAPAAIKSAFAGPAKLVSSPAAKIALPIASTVASVAATQQQKPAQEAATKSAEAGKNTISKFTRSAPTPAADLAQQSASIQRNNIVPLSRSSSDSGKAVAGGLASGINSGKGEASKAAAGLAQSVSDYLPRSPAKVGPLADLNKTGSGLISEFTKGIDGGAVASKMESALKPPSMFGNLPFEGKQETAQNTITYAPNYSLNGVDRDNFIAELEKHDRQFMDWLQKTQDRFSRGRY